MLVQLLSGCLMTQIHGEYLIRSSIDNNLIDNMLRIRLIGVESAERRGNLCYDSGGQFCDPMHFDLYL